MNLTRLAVLPLLLAGSSIALASGTAYADEYTHHDPAGDVSAVKTRSSQPTPVSGHREVDATLLHVKHGRAALTLSVRLRGVPARAIILNDELRTPTQRIGLLALKKPARLGLTHTVTLFAASGESIGCRRATLDVRPARHLVTVTVPRACLDRPAWVRVAASTARFAKNGRSYFVDDANAPGIDSEALTFSRRIQVG